MQRNLASRAGRAVSAPKHSRWTQAWRRMEFNGGGPQNSYRANYGIYRILRSMTLPSLSFLLFFPSWDFPLLFLLLFLTQHGVFMQLPRQPGLGVVLQKRGSCAWLPLAGCRSVPCQRGSVTSPEPGTALLSELIARPTALLTCARWRGRKTTAAAKPTWRIFCPYLNPLLAFLSCYGDIEQRIRTERDS